MGTSKLPKASLSSLFMAKTCPDSVFSSLYDLAISRASGPLRILGCNIKLDFAATGSTSSAIRIFKDQISICAKGAIFDVNINISDEVDFDSSDFSSTHLQAQSRLMPIQRSCLESMYEGILSVKRLSKNASGINYIKTLFEILIGARIQQGLVKEIHLLKGEFDSALAHLHHSESINDRPHDIMIRQSILAKTLSVLDMVMMLDTGFCVTARGYVGRVSRSVKKGDFIAVILGGPVAFQLAEA